MTVSSRFTHDEYTADNKKYCHFHIFMASILVKTANWLNTYTRLDAV